MCHIKPVYDPNHPDGRHSLTANLLNQAAGSVQYTAVLVVVPVET